MESGSQSYAQTPSQAAESERDHMISRESEFSEIEKVKDDKINNLKF